MGVARRGLTGRGLQGGVAGLLGWGHMRLIAGQLADRERQGNRLTRSRVGQTGVGAHGQSDRQTERGGSEHARKAGGRQAGARRSFAGGHLAANRSKECCQLCVIYINIHKLPA